MKPQPILVDAMVSDGSLHNLLCYLCQFHMFLRESGEPAPDYVVLLSYHVLRKMPVRSYVTDDELSLLFHEIDKSESRRDSLQPFLFSTIFRLIYTSGLWPNEGWWMAVLIQRHGFKRNLRAFSRRLILESNRRFFRR